MYSECEDEVPQDILEEANVVSLNLLPLKYLEKYEKRVPKFSKKCADLTPSTLWSKYSMLRSTLQIKDNIDINFAKLVAFLKGKSPEYKAKKANTFSRENINKFIADPEGSYNISTYLSQPNVEAGMDKEESSIQFARRISEQNCKYPSKDGGNVQCMFKSRHDNIINDFIKLSSESQTNSYDDFHNMIVTFENNSSINRVPLTGSQSSQNTYFQPPKGFLPNDSWASTSDNTGHIGENVLEANSLEPTDLDPLCYLVYQHYFRSPRMLHKAVEKSRNLFRSNYKPNNNREEYATHKNLVSLKDCKVCGCPIESCQSEIQGKTCVCSKEAIPQISKRKDTFQKSRKQPCKKLKRIISKHCLPKNRVKKNVGICRSKKSVGIICFPENVDVGICTKLGSKINQKQSKKCYCIKCEKRSVDGSCYCSHCLGIFDKSVGIQPFNKEVATQCTCHESKNVDTTKFTSNNGNPPKGNEELNATDVSNTEHNRTEQVVRHEYDKSNEYNNNFQTNNFLASESDSEVNRDIKHSNNEGQEEPLITNIEKESEFNE